MIYELLVKEHIDRIYAVTKIHAKAIVMIWKKQVSNDLSYSFSARYKNIFLCEGHILTPQKLHRFLF